MPVNHKRIRILKDIAAKTGPVIYWMSRDQRMNDNWAFLFAQSLAIQEKVANLKIDQFELDKKGRNVAVTIIEEYGDNDTLSDTDLIYLIKNFLSSFHDHDEVSKITKQAMATIHHKKGKINDAEFAQIMNVDEDKLEDVMLN